MSNHRALTLRLPVRDFERLEARARSHRVTADAMAQMLLHDCLLAAATSPRVALQRMDDLRRDLAPVDVVEIVRQGRGDLEERGQS
ncbi:MAG: hypothetical protein HC897_05740 [Thermoanaerobaculia bacterium]|nr:hypothetical protein [Thermoanaerobaculia bacterium]